MRSDNTLPRPGHGARGSASPAMRKLARFGYLTKGVVYAVIGVLALMAALGSGGETTGATGAIARIGSQPFGRVLLVVTGIGLAGYATWRVVQAVADTENAGRDGKGIVKRLGYVASGVIYGALAIAALQMGLGSGGSGAGQQTYIAKLMAVPFGQLLVGAIGAIIIGVGIYELYRAYRADFMKKLDTGELSATKRTWVRRLGRMGYAARGIVFPIIGYFVLRAAITYEPGQARDFGGALSTLDGIVLGIVAVGLIAYAVFQLVEARYRRISV